MDKIKFDPAEHLTKQGWKGKGTALKHGHATRPLPVVQKKTLSGIGKDRDEAIPFWDHIFASTAATLLIPSANTAIGSTTRTNNVTPRPPPTSTPPAPPPARTALSPSARMGREVARRGLYSRFFKGTSASLAQETEEVEEEVIDSGPSVEKAKPVESKEERRMRRDIKARRRASREAGRRSGAAEAGNDRPELQSGAVIRERPEVAMPLGVKRDHSGGLGRDAVGMESEERKRKKRRREKGLGV